jgi:hypothetical protein
VNTIKVDLREIGGLIWTAFMWLRIGISGWLCQHCNERSDSIKTFEFLE